MAFYNRDNVFTRAKQAKKRIHIDLKQDDQAADILSAPHIPHREAESEKALNHTPKHEAQFDTDDPIHCKRKRGEDTTVKPADDSSEDSNNSLPTFSHQEQYLEPKIETVIESTVETIRPLNDNFEDRVQFNQEYVSTKATQVMKRKEDDSEQDIQLLQENTDTATSTELHLRASVIEKSSEDIQSNVLRAGYVCRNCFRSHLFKKYVIWSFSFSVTVITSLVMTLNLKTIVLLAQAQQNESKASLTGLQKIRFKKHCRQ
nr:uncharacterized protein LOC115265161 [Aedes albopictus]